MKNEFVKLMELDGVQFENGNVRSKLSGKQKLLNHIDKEINTIKNRKDLTLLRVKKGDLILNENRFFRNSDNENEVFVTLKFKGKILSNKLLVRVNKNKKDVIDMITKMKNVINEMDSKSEFFNQIK